MYSTWIGMIPCPLVTFNAAKNQLVNQQREDEIKQLQHGLSDMQVYWETKWTFKKVSATNTCILRES